MTAAVFSVASRSQQIAGDSARLHALNEALRATTVVRAQISIATLVSNVDQTYGTDSGAAALSGAAEWSCHPGAGPSRGDTSCIYGRFRTSRGRSTAASSPAAWW